MRRTTAILLAVISAGTLAFAGDLYLFSLELPVFSSPSSVFKIKTSLQTTTDIPVTLEKIPKTVVATTSEPFIYSFNVDGVLEESATPEESSSPYWWLDSGARLIIKKNLGLTVQGDLPMSDTWRIEYAGENPGDTAGGAHPQNLFRLVSLTSWRNVSEQTSFKIAKDNLDDSTNRNESNGLLLFSRYKDSATLYYAGMRVDGTAVIKKKYHGDYYTMAQNQIVPGKYDRTTSPNLLPHGQWIDLKCETKTDADGSVDIKLYVLLPDGAGWRLALEARDDSQYAHTPPILAGNIGIRTDFMDVEFSNFRAETI